MGHKFKAYNQQQKWLFPPSIEELIPQDHPGGVVNEVIEQLVIKPLIEAYSYDGQLSPQDDVQGDWSMPIWTILTPAVKRLRDAQAIADEEDGILLLLILLRSIRKG